MMIDKTSKRKMLYKKKYIKVSQMYQNIRNIIKCWIKIKTIFKTIIEIKIKITIKKIYEKLNTS